MDEQKHITEPLNNQYPELTLSSELKAYLQYHEDQINYWMSKIGIPREHFENEKNKNSNQ